jgi:hypothetical protein
MIEYYRDPQVTVTSDAVRVDGRAYGLAELARVWHRRGRRSWSSVAGRGALGVAMLGPIVFAVLGIVIAVQIDASTSTTIALVGGAILVGFGAGPLADILLEHMDRSYARGSRRLEIWAEVRGTAVLLLTTTDALRFGQIYRALQRALERGTPAARRRGR